MGYYEERRRDDVMASVMVLGSAAIAVGILTVALIWRCFNG